MSNDNAAHSSLITHHGKKQVSVRFIKQYVITQLGGD